ncbi:MAG: ATP-binding protein [Pelobium sp.]
MQEDKILVSSTITKDSFYHKGQVAVLEAAGLSGVCTDENLMVVLSFGDNVDYLRKQNFNRNLCDLLPDQLSVKIKVAASHAFQSKHQVTLNGISFENEQTSAKYSANVVINPYLNIESNEPLLLILFTTIGTQNKDLGLLVPEELKQLTRKHLVNLEQELETTKQNLDVAYQMIDASNENVQSFNEELQSANEEMQSANEELQSVNEELQTINKEQHDTNVELTESNDNLNNYFRSNTNGQLFVDHNLFLKKYSPGAVKLINLQESDIGRPLAHITTNIKFETLIEDIKKVILDGKSIIREAESSDGKIYQVMTMPYIRENDHLTDGAIISFYDITELKQLLSALDISNKRLTDNMMEIELSKEQVSLSLEKEKHLNLMKSRFVSMASHEFKTPLTSIQLSAELIGRLAVQLDQPVIKKYTLSIKNASKNLNNILNDYLSLELLETGKINPILSEFDIVKFAQDLIDDMSSLAKPNQQLLYSHSGKQHLVTLNPSLLKNCIINLISNAIKYSGPDSNIECHTKTTSKELMIIISDNGIGIPKKDQKHLFEAFFRAHNTGNIPGTGLGLNIVTRYTELMKGKIRFKSQEGKGTTFTINFPIRPNIQASGIVKN